jgi:hypothetical protein
MIRSEDEKVGLGPGTGRGPGGLHIAQMQWVARSEGPGSGALDWNQLGACATTGVIFLVFFLSSFSVAAFFSSFLAFTKAAFFLPKQCSYYIVMCDVQNVVQQPIVLSVRVDL